MITPSTTQFTPNDFFFLLQSDNFCNNRRQFYRGPFQGLHMCFVHLIENLNTNSSQNRVIGKVLCTDTLHEQGHTHPRTHRHTHKCHPKEYQQKKFKEIKIKKKNYC